MDRSLSDLPLFGAARRTDPPTAVDAARRVPAQDLAARVVQALRLRGPSTMHQIADFLGVSLVSISPRFAPLRRAGRIEQVGRCDGRAVWRCR